MSLSDRIPTSVRRSVIFVVAFLALFPAVVGAGTAEPRFIRHGGAVPSEYIVVLPDDTSSESVDVITAALARDYRLKVIRTFHKALPGFHCRASSRAAQRLAKDARVAFVEENFTGRVAAEPNWPSCTTATNGWTRYRINHRDNAVPLTDPIPYQAGSGGKDVVAFILDTGVLATHAQFGGRVGTGYDAVAKREGKDPSASRPCDNVDANNASHGTSVASLLGGATMGVAPEVTIEPVRVIPCSDNWQTADVLDGLEWVANYQFKSTEDGFKGAVLNMSFEAMATTVDSQLPMGVASIKAAIGRVTEMGVVAFAVAGNFPYGAGNVPIGDGDSCEQAIAQLGYGNDQTAPHVVVSSGTDLQDKRRSGCEPVPTPPGVVPPQPEHCAGKEFGRGRCVDLFAPATCVYAAALGASNDAKRQTGFIGTSFASPMSAGVAARLLAENPLYDKDHRAATPYKVWRMLRDTATRDMVVDAGETPIGFGSPNRLLYIGGLKIDTEPRSVVVQQSTTGTTDLSVAATPKSGSLSYQWYRANDNPMIGGPYQTADTFKAPGEGATTALYKAKTDITRSYWVRVTDGGQLTADSMLAAVTTCSTSYPRPAITAKSPSVFSSGVCSSPTAWALSVDDNSGESYDWYIGSPGDTNKFVAHTSTTPSLPGSCLLVTKPPATNDYWVRVNHANSCPVDSAGSGRIDGICQRPVLEPLQDQVLDYDPNVYNAPVPTATFTAEATGSDLTYAWYRVDGPNPSTPISTQAAIRVELKGDVEQTYYVVVTSGCSGQVSVSRNATATWVNSASVINIRNPNEPVDPLPLNPYAPFDPAHHVVKLASSQPGPTIYVPYGRPIALTAQPGYVFSSTDIRPTKAKISWISKPSQPLSDAVPYFFKDVTGTVTATAKQGVATVTGYATIQPCGVPGTPTTPAHVLIATAPSSSNDGNSVSVTLTANVSNATVEWYRSEHDDHLGPLAQQRNVASGATVQPGIPPGLGLGRYWVRVIGHLDNCSAANVTEDSEMFQIGLQNCNGRCPGQRLRTGVPRVGGVATTYFVRSGDPVQLTPPKDIADGDTYEWRHNPTWDLNEVPFSTDYQIDDAPVGTYWVSTTYLDGSIDDSWVTTIASPPDPVMIPVDVYPHSRFVGGQATVIMIAHPPQPPANACDVQYKWWQGSSVDDPAKFTLFDPDNNPFQIDLFDVPDTATFWFEMSWRELHASGCPTVGSRMTRRSEYIEITVTCDPPAAVSAAAIPDPHVRKNELVTLYASGWGKLLTYKWYQGPLGNKTTFAGDGRTLYKTFPGDLDKWDMWVEVVDACDNVSSAPLQIFVCRPSIVTEPAEMTVIRSGQTKQISVGAEPASGQQLFYQWYNADVDGRGTTAAIPGATAASLDVTAPAGKYFCHVRSMCDDDAEAVAITRTAQVDVCAPPIIAWMTASQDVRENETKTIQVEATGAELTYQWYRGETGDISHPIAGATGASHELLLPDTTKVWVRIVSRGECSIDSQTVTLTVCKAPQLNSGPTANPPVVFSGGTSTLTVSATQTSAALLHYTWYEVTDLGNVLVCSDQPTCTTEPLTAAKTYFVRITSGTLVAIESPQVTVSVCTFPQTIPGAPDVQVSANTPYFLTLPIDPPDGNTITWYRGASGNTGTPVQTGPGPQLIINETVSGHYWAKVERGGCTSSSTTTNVLVCVPKAIAQPLPASIIAGESHTMTFGVGGTDAPLTYQWYRGEPGNDRDPVAGQTSSSMTVSPAVTTTYFSRATSNCGRILDSNATVVNVCTRPVITGASGSSIAPGQNGVVSVSATGSDLTYQWYRGASGNTTQLITGAVNPTFAESPAATSVYWCRVTNGTCWTDSPNATITVCAPPTITTQPADVTIAAGQTTQLSVAASGATGHQWLLGDGTPISGATSATYTTPVLNEDATYRVRVYNGLCTTDSREVKVTACNLSVGVTPVVKIMRSQTANLSTSVMNARSQDLSYTWYIGASGNTSQAWAAGPPSIAVSPQDTTQYWVRVTDGICTADSNTATVEICVPTITQQPANIMRVSNQASVALSVTATPATAFQWYIGEKGDITTPVPGGTTATINVSPTVETRYWVRVAGTCGVDERGAPIGTTDSESSLVTICDPPAITQSTPSQWIARGTSATFGVFATGTNPTYQWYIGASGDASAPIAGANTATYTVAPQNTTSYWVRVSGTCGTANSATITISVCMTPSITAQPQSVSIFSGSSVTLSVAATEGTTSPMSYQWYRGVRGDTSVPIGANASTYTTPALTSETNYWVRVSCGTCTPADSNTVMVSTCAYPQSVSGAANVQTTVGQSVRLTAPQSNVSNLYLWYRGASGDQTNPLTGWQAANFIDVAPTVTTQYWYRLQNGTCTSNSATTTVSVCVPTITTQPANVLINAGASTTLSVVANTTGLTYQWYVGASGTTTSPIAGATGASVTVSPAANTNYWARVTSSCGRTADSNTAAVTICQVPAISSINPVTQWIARGQTTTINVSATGTNLTYQWYAGSSGNTASPIIGGTGASISVAPQNTSTYWVKVTGSCGTVNSATATVQVCAAPSITTHPQSVSIFSGTSTALSVTAFEATTSPMSYQWYRGLSGDSSVPVGTSSSTFTTPNLTVDTSYWVRVSCGTCSPASSNTATVSMCAYPQSVTGAANVQTTVGQSVRLTASQSNVSNQYLWYRGASGDVSTPLSGWQVANYLDVAPTVTTNYWYRLQNGSCISNSTTTTVSVCVPTITTNPQSVTIAGGTSTTLTVAANMAVTYQWYIGASGTTTSPVAGGTAASLTVSPATTTTYWARATSTCGRTADSAAATVTICQAPVITRQPLNAVPVNGGQTSYTDVIATGTNLTYQWYEGESGDMSAPIICGPRDACVSTTSSLSILVYSSKRVWVRIAGMCSAVNSNATWLSVYPAIFSQPTGSSVNYGSTATVDVGAGGTALHYAWKWSNGTPVAGATDSPRLILSSVTANVYVYCEITSGVAVRASQAAEITLCNGPYITSVSVSPAGGNCRYVTVNVANPYTVSTYLWYQGTRGNTTTPLTLYNGSSQLYVCPTSSTTYWCRVVGYDETLAVTCYTDTQAVTVP